MRSPLRVVSLISSVLTVTGALLPTVPAGFTNEEIAIVRKNLIQVANQSWELGTAAEALTEFSWPALSVFNASAFPPPAHLNVSLNATDVLLIANRTVSNKPPTSLALIASEGSAADPASIGVSVLLANWTRPDLTNTAYAQAAGDQLKYLLGSTPRSDAGAISHRASEVQLWADYVYMVPPFIAYFGALQGGEGGKSLLQIAYDQCRLYRDALRDPSGLWRHITLGSWQDDTHWATGNGWAAAGMLRVLQTLNHSSQAEKFAAQQANLTEWIQEILVASWANQKPNGTLFNVIDDPTSFGDTAGTALLASVTYRMAAINNDTTLIPAANRALKLIQDSVDEEGWLHSAVDPYTFHNPLAADAHSPEGQAFVLLLHSAWRAFSNVFSQNKRVITLV
ncbi:Six-hairpin glycosidase-like protein [Crucibulum laeve]|uniref:Six-hairpin glycosidase-like protein n=1 Tax=Crucibulum laeve TaxID=68775 RepID=A0A5C3MED4_9AGAR|nr:Six-hairpin glycosidase-like protein [Crucibulum laeve]